MGVVLEEGPGALSAAVIGAGLSWTKPKGVVAPGKVLPSPSFSLVLAPMSGFTKSAGSRVSANEGCAQTDAAAKADNPANFLLVILRDMNLTCLSCTRKPMSRSTPGFYCRNGRNA